MSIVFLSNDPVISDHKVYNISHGHKCKYPFLPQHTILYIFGENQEDACMNNVVTVVGDLGETEAGA